MRSIRVIASLLSSRSHDVAPMELASRYLFVAVEASDR
jgi:hypothetical protein